MRNHVCTKLATLHIIVVYIMHRVCFLLVRLYNSYYNYIIVCATSIISID